MISLFAGLRRSIIPASVFAVAFASIVAVTLAVDNSVEAQEFDFRFAVMDVFEITGSDYDVIASGLVKSGQIRAGQTGCVVSVDSSQLQIEIVAINKSRKLVDIAETGNIVALGIIGATEEQISKGDSIVDRC